MPLINRRRFGLAVVGSIAGHRLLQASEYLDEKASRFRITGLELTEYEGHYEGEAGVSRQPQVNPLDVYDSVRPGPYRDKPGGTKTFPYKAIYLLIKTNGELFGLYGPFEKEAAVVVGEELSKFLVGKDPLAGEALWNKMYRSNRHSREAIFLMAISAVDNTL